MDRTESRGRRSIRRLAAVGTLSLIGLQVFRLVPSECHAQALASARPTWVEAVAKMKAKGIPTILIVTSRAVPDSAASAKAVLASPALARLKDAVQVSEICVEDEPEQAKNLLATQFPTFVGLRAGIDGRLVLVGSRRGSMSAEELVGWAWGIGLGEPAESKTSAGADTGVVKTGLFHRNDAPPAPSPQYAVPQAPMKVIPYLPPAPLPPPLPPPMVEREVVSEQPVEREIIIEREVVTEPAPREVIREVVVETAPAPREVVREIIREAAPRTVTREVTAAPRNVLTRSVPPSRTREVVVERSAPRTVTREVAPARREVIREVIREAAPREVVREVVREAAPREVVREVAATRVRDVEPAAKRAVNLIRPGLFGRAIGGMGERLRIASLPRIDVAVERETRYRPLAPRERSVYLSDSAPETYAVEAAPRHSCFRGCGHGPAQPPAPTPAYSPPQPVYATPPPVYVPPYAPSPQR